MFNAKDVERYGRRADALERLVKRYERKIWPMIFYSKRYERLKRRWGFAIDDMMDTLRRVSPTSVSVYKKPVDRESHLYEYRHQKLNGDD